jgi:hypothetical protein
MEECLHFVARLRKNAPPEVPTVHYHLSVRADFPLTVQSRVASARARPPRYHWLQTDVRILREYDHRLCASASGVACQALTRLGRV